MAEKIERYIQAIAGLRGERARSRHKVFAAVGLQDVLQAVPLQVGFFHVDAAIDLRVDDRCLSPVADEIGIMGDPFRLNPFEKHVFRSFLRNIRRERV